MSVANKIWKALTMSGVVLSVPLMAGAQPRPPVPPVPPAPVIAPMPPIPPMPVIPPMPMIPGALLDFEMPEIPEMPDLSFVGPAIDGAMDALAGIGFGPIGPGPIGPGPSGFGPIGAGPRLADLQSPRSPEEEARRQADRERQREEEAKQREAERRQRIDERYQRGQELLENRSWARAADAFTQVIEAQNSTRVDAALYWKAYALDKLNQQADALAAVQDLIKRFPQSRWLSDARALELQVRQNAGQAPRPENESDEE
ncbi:MAG: tetratricopeptide repeat protein, partial [Vicinamibacterales bacterium]